VEETGVASFNTSLQYRYLLGRIEENHEKLAAVAGIHSGLETSIYVLDLTVVEIVERSTIDDKI
jgi:hypothetical protein